MEAVWRPEGGWAAFVAQLRHPLGRMRGSRLADRCHLVAPAGCAGRHYGGDTGEHAILLFRQFLLGGNLSAIGMSVGGGRTEEASNRK